MYYHHGKWEGGCPLLRGNISIIITVYRTPLLPPAGVLLLNEVLPMFPEGIYSLLNFMSSVVIPIDELLPCLVHGVDTPFVLPKLRLKGVVLLQLRLEVGGVAIALI